MTAPPLTHHDILALVAPFTRAGRHVDLAATDRVQRRIAFQPLSRADVAELPGLTEQLALEKFGATSFRLTRTLVLPGGLQARLDASGADPGELLRQVDVVPVATQFQTGDGFVIARDCVLRSDAQAPVLTRAVVQLAAATLTLSVPAVRSVSADVLLAAPPGQSLDIPQDLLAVLGWAWSPVSNTRQGWSGKFRLRGTPDKRTQRADQALARVAVHLARTLAASPAAFHEQHTAARWSVVWRRAIPILMPLLILVTVLALPRLGLRDISGVWTLVYQLPTVLIAISFMTQDVPKFEIPPWPRRASASSWLRQRQLVETPHLD
ncbi:MAG: hypothetical protein BWK72_19340 [Rhodoferax ferrireducens]|uniref:Uncharacterized protein n=1 Tax=Rhodoferax ferrireducens TaxID=192843 RepID=A0A1W9KQ88_9BURK|nr:MAG: hypothetical protein BWK72_19340 [Rhodoferax ferrireducens]